MSVTVTDAVSLLASEGVKVTPIVQVAPTATELPQVSATSAKSAALVPVIARLLMLNAVLPPLVRVTVWAELVEAIGWFPKEILVGERVTPAAAVPVPERLTVCGLPVALSVIVTVAVRLPVAAGVKVTLIVQLPPAATELPQVLVCAKSLGLVPVMARLEMVKVAVPVLLRVAVCAPLVEATAWLLKEMLLGETPAAGAVPVPDKLMV